MQSCYDVVIIGGGVIGAAVACYTANAPDFDGSILVVERDPTYKNSSTALSAASIRVQFSNPLNIQISQYGLDVIRNFPEFTTTKEPGPSLTFQEAGYLYLAGSKVQADVLKSNHAVQVASGADVVLWTARELSDAFPHLNVDDIELASFGRSGEGWFDNMGLLQGFRKKAMSLGVEFLRDEVVALKREGKEVVSAELASGNSVHAGIFVNAAGPRAAQVARMAEIPLPVEARKRTVFVFDCACSPEGSAQVNAGKLPLMIDSSGIWCRPEGRHFLAAAVPEPDAAVEYDDFDPNYDEFEERVWPALAHRSKSFESLRVVNQWAGHYAYNILDQNLIIGPHPDVDNLFFANGFSGHGLQQAPAVGRAVSELITGGGYRTLDLSPFGFERVLENRPIYERCII